MNDTDYIRQRVAALEPGQQIEVSRHVMGRAKPRGFMAWLREESSADRILENIVGSSYEFWYEENPMTGNTTFGRLNTPLEDGRRSYVSPDRRRHYTREGRLWRPVNHPPVI